MFGLSLYTTERDLREVFSKYGPLSDVSIVYDQQSRRSRGFAFVYFENKDDAKEVRAHALANVEALLGVFSRTLGLISVFLSTVRQRNEPTEWNWMVAGSGWTSPSQKDLTLQPLGSTWAGLHSKPCETSYV